MRAFGWRVGAGAAWPEARLGMSGRDRAGDGPDAIPDMPRRESAAAGVGRGTILAEARTRREYALACRATLDAVYAKAELDAGARRPGDSQAADYTAAKRPDITATLNASFERMLTRYREVQRAMPELAPKPKKREFRRRKRR